MKRVLLFGGLAVLVVVGIVAYLGLSRLDSLVASAIERYGSEITGVPVRVGSVSIQLTEGRGTIRGLRVGNPEGFTSGNAFELGEITLDIDPKSVTATPIVIDELTVAAPEANFEMSAAGRSNFDVIKGNVDRYSGASTGGGEGAEPEPGDDLRLRIRRFTFADASVTADVSQVSAETKPLAVDMPSVKLENVGGERGGTPAEVGKQVLGSFTGAVVRTVAASQAQRQVEERIGGEAGRAAGKVVRGLLD